MRTIKFLTIIAAFCSLMSLSSCSKPDDGAQAATFEIEVSNIRATLAVVDINLEKKAELVRFLNPMPKAEFEAAVGNTSDAATVKSFISENGEPIDLPFNKILTPLEKGTEYVIGVVAYDANMNLFAYKTVTFSTLESDDRVVGDPSAPGSLTENIL